MPSIRKKSNILVTTHKSPYKLPFYPTKSYRHIYHTYKLLTTDTAVECMWFSTTHSTMPEFDTGTCFFLSFFQPNPKRTHIDHRNFSLHLGKICKHFFLLWKRRGGEGKAPYGLDMIFYFRLIRVTKEGHCHTKFTLKLIKTITTS